MKSSEYYTFRICYKIIELLTAKVKTLTKNEQAAKNHWNLHTSLESSILMPANKTIVDAGINILVINKSASAIFTINAFPAKFHILYNKKY